MLRSLKKTPVDNVVGHMALVFELVYPISAQLAEEQHYLDQLMNFVSDNETTQRQFALLRAHMQEYLKRRRAEISAVEVSGEGKGRTGDTADRRERHDG